MKYITYLFLCQNNDKPKRNDVKKVSKEGIVIKHSKVMQEQTTIQYCNRKIKL